jgi:hypothetical protein
MYHGGTYGTYLHWCLETLCSAEPVVSPFTNIGNSHMFSGKTLLNIDGWHQYMSSGKKSKIVRLHPKTKQTEKISTNLDKIMSTVDRAIYIYPDSDSVLLTINNYYSKIWTNWWKYQFDNHINQEKIYNNWPVTRSVPIDQLPIWVQREFLSLYLVPAWQSQVEWQTRGTWQHPNCYVVFVSDILYNFKSTLESIGEFCQFEFQKLVKDLVPYHAQNIKLQKYIGQDLICNNIVNSVISDQTVSWSPLSVVSEAWIQWELRNRGLEIRCHDLDKFPTNSVHLKELLYPV